MRAITSCLYISHIMRAVGPLICLDNGLFQVVKWAGEIASSRDQSSSSDSWHVGSCCSAPPEVWWASFRENSCKGSHPPHDLRGHKCFIGHTADSENLIRQVRHLKYRTKRCVWTTRETRMNTGRLITFIITRRLFHDCFNVEWMVCLCSQAHTYGAGWRQVTSVQQHFWYITTQEVQLLFFCFFKSDPSHDLNQFFWSLNWKWMHLKQPII